VDDLRDAHLAALRRDADVQPPARPVGASPADRRAHRTVIRPEVGKHLGGAHVHPRAHEDMIDLAMWMSSRPGAAAHRTLPAAHERAHAESPEVAVAGNDRRTVFG